MLLRFLFICCPNIRTHLKLDFVDTQGLLQSPYSKRGACSWSLHDVSAYTEVTHKETECELSRHLWSIVLPVYVQDLPLRGRACLSLAGQPCLLLQFVHFPLSSPREAWCSLLWLPLLHLTRRDLQNTDPGIGTLNYIQVTERRRGLRRDPERSWSWSSFAITQIEINFSYVLSNSCLG